MALIRELDLVNTDGTSSFVVDNAVIAPSAFNLSDLDGSNGFTVDLPKSIVGKQEASIIGDINGDGIDDIAFSNYVIFGSPAGSSNALDAALTAQNLKQTLETTLDGSNGFIIRGLADDTDGFDPQETAVSAAGDINGDGVDDLVLGRPGSSSRDGKLATSYIMFGAETFSRELEIYSLNGSNGFSFSGAGDSVGQAGDINGDGLDDIVLGAPGNISRSGEDRSIGDSRAVFLFGRSDGFDSNLAVEDIDGSSGFVVEGIAPGDYGNSYIGNSVSGLGDVNGDGIDDAIISAPATLSSYVIFGNNEGFEPILTLLEISGSKGFAIAPGFNSVSSAGDINGDRLGDIIIGASGDFSTTTDRSYVVFGSTESGDRSLDLERLDGTNGFEITSQSKRGIGYSAAGLGDVNGDGIDDIIIGSAGSDYTGSRPGDSYVIFGSTEQFGSRLELDSLSSREGFVIAGGGRSVGGRGDVNADGVNDIVIADRQPDAQVGDRNSGVGYVIFGQGSVALPITAPIIEGTNQDDSLPGTLAGDRIFGLADNDTLEGKQGDDRLDGGLGTDTAFYLSSPTGLIVDLQSETASDGFGGTDTLVSIENVIGSDFNDEITGDDSDNNLTGGGGDDILSGGLGDDVLIGDNGADQLIGGGGADIFLYKSIADIGDAIADFESGTDKLMIASEDFGGVLSKGALPTEEFFVGTEASLGSHRLVYSAKTGVLLFDEDGAGGEDGVAIATLVNIPTLSEKDVFVL